MKIGVGISVDVKKIDKSRLAKGKYLNLTTFIDLDNQDKYDQNGFVTEQQTKEEREDKIQLPIIGNVKVFWKEEQQSQPDQGQGTNQQEPDDDSQIPF